MKVEGFTDTDFAGDLDRKRSLIGYVFTLLGNTMSWKSNLQSTMALSTIEVEYIACIEAIKEILWIKGFMSKLRVS